VLIVVIAVVGVRSGLLVTLAVPFSFFFAFIIITLMGFTYNFMVIFGLLLGIAALLVCEEDEAQGPRIRGFLDSAQAVIMKLVHIVMALTPYGVLALMTRVVATSDGAAIVTLIAFVVASYLAIALMFGVHAVIIALAGTNSRDYFRKVWPVLTFAFVTRSSAATIPLTIRAQIEELRVPPPIANCVLRGKLLMSKPKRRT